MKGWIPTYMVLKTINEFNKKWMEIMGGNDIDSRNDLFLEIFVYEINLETLQILRL